MLLCDCVQDYFRTYLVQQRGYGPNTLASYADTFRVLLSWLSEVKGLDVAKMGASELDARLVGSFLDWLEEDRDNSVSTRNTRLAHLRSYASYTLAASPEDAGACASVAAIPAKSAPKEPPDALSREETDLLLAHPGTATRRGLRDSALLALLYDSACRVQELVDMDVSDVRLSPPCSVHVVGKGNKARTIPLLPETGELLARYVEAFSLGSKSPLFTNRRGSRLTRAGVAYTVRTHWEGVVAEHPGEVAHEKVSPHLLRHTKATHLVEEHVSPHHVRDFLGHSFLSTTQVYFRTNVERMREEVESAAEGTVGKHVDYYTPDRREELERYLDGLAGRG